MRSMLFYACLNAWPILPEDGWRNGSVGVRFSLVATMLARTHGAYQFLKTYVRSYTGFLSQPFACTPLKWGKLHKSHPIG